MQRRAQIWVESVIYTLIGIAIISLMLLVTKPKIQSTQDEFVVQQTLKALNDLDNKITEVMQATNNRRLVDFQLSRGTLLIDATNSKIQWELDDSSYMYSEPGFDVNIGSIRVRTDNSSGDQYIVKLTLDYSNKNKLTISKQIGSKELQPAKVPYSLVIENYGLDASTNLINIDISIT